MVTGLSTALDVKVGRDSLSGKKINHIWHMSNKVTSSKTDAKRPVSHMYYIQSCLEPIYSLKPYISLKKIIIFTTRKCNLVAYNRPAAFVHSNFTHYIKKSDTTEIWLLENYTGE